MRHLRNIFQLAWPRLILGCAIVLGWVTLSVSGLAGQLAPAPAHCHLDFHGSEANVDLIGHRNVGHGLDFYSMQHEIALGQSEAQQVIQNSKLITDPEVNEYINRIAQNLVRHSDAHVPFTVHVVQNSTINAFALPGGFFFVNSGLILASRAEDELAGAMAHEIGHVAARHATRNMTKDTLLQLATLPLEIAVGGSMGGWGGVLAEQGANFALPYQFMRYSRAAEREADWLGTQYLWNTGYDPEGLIHEFQHIEKLEVERPGLMARAYASHPETPSRIAETQCEIARVLPPRPQYVVNTSDFHRIQHRLARLIHMHLASFRTRAAQAPHKPRKFQPPVLARPKPAGKPAAPPASPFTGGH